MTYEPDPLLALDVFDYIPNTPMFPESSETRSDWLDRPRSQYVLRAGFVHSCVLLATAVTWCCGSFQTGPSILAAQEPAAGAISDATGNSIWRDHTFFPADFTLPMPGHQATPRTRVTTRSARGTWLSQHLKLVADEPDDPEKFPPEPDIDDPGPDMGDYPNSAFTLPKGRAYVELAPLTLQTGNSQVAGAYNFPYLLRYGITDDVEIRLIGNGITSIFNEGNTRSGFSPLLIDSKVHLWDDNMERFIPAASLEVFIQTNLATEIFQAGVQPSISLNLDFPVNEKTNIEMTIGYTSVQDTLAVITGSRFDAVLGHDVPVVTSTNVSSQQFSYQWAIEYAVTDDLEVFLHGYYNGAVYLQSGTGEVVGTGWFYQVSSKIMLFSSYNFGLDSSSPPFSTQLGMAFAL